MKKPCLLLLLLFSISIVNLHAGNAIINGIHYSFDSNSGQCTVEYSSAHITLIEVIIPDSVYYDNTWYIVTSIGNSAFSDCSELTSIEIPGSVTNIDQYAFYNCTGLTSMNIPGIVKNIGEYAFYNCTGLTSIEIPDSVTKICQYTFYHCSGLNSIEIPGSMQIIDAYAFSGCSGLTSISLPDITIGLGDYAFSDCTGLTSVKVPGGRKRVGRRWIEGSYVFSNCTGLTSVSFYNVTTIGSNYFSGCSGLTSISIPDGVTSIGSYAFSGCSGLTSVTIPITVIGIGLRAFYGCSGLSSIVVPEGNKVYDSRNNCNAIIQTNTNKLLYGSENTIIPDDVISIGNEAFYGLSGLNSISIPGCVTSIGLSAFAFCSGLTSIAIPGSVTNIGDNAFSGCCKLTSISIPDSVSGIGDLTFKDCIALTSITIPGSVTSIGNSAFSGCTGLTSITIPGSVTSIDDWAFSGCESIKYCTFGCNSNIIVGKISLDNVEKITLTEDVSDFSSFQFPEHLDTLVSLATTTPPKISGFSDIKKENLIVQIPNGAMLIYLQADGWKEFLNYKEGDNATISLPQLDLYYSNSLSVHLADKSVIRIILNYEPAIEFSPDNMTLRLLIKGYEYAFDNVGYIDYSVLPSTNLTDVGSIEDDNMISIIVEEGSVMVSGTKKNAVVMLVSADGKLILNTTTDGEGKVKIPMYNLEKGVYVVKTDGLTFKFAKL